MSVIFSQVPVRLRRALGRFVGLAGAALFSLVLASCAGGGFGRTGDAGNTPDIPGVNPVSEPVSAAAGPIPAESQRKVAEVVSGLDLGEETLPISPEDIAVSNDSGILDSNPFSSPAPAARSSGWGARADSARKTQGYKAFEVAVPSENPLMTVAVWISETPPDYPEGKPEQDPEADRKFLYLRLRVFIEVGHVALVEGGGVEVLDSEVIVVEEKRPDPKPVVPEEPESQPDPSATVLVAEDADNEEEPESPQAPECPVGTFRAADGTCACLPWGILTASGKCLLALNVTVAAEDADNEEESEASQAPECRAGEFRGEDGNCAPMLGADLRCPAGTMSNKWTEADLIKRAGGDELYFPYVPNFEFGRVTTAGLNQEELNRGLARAIDRGNEEGACEFLRRGADVDALARKSWLYHLGDGFIPLNRAVKLSNLSMVKLLLANGADLEARSKYHSMGGRFTPLMWAVQDGPSEIAELLIDRGADVNSPHRMNDWRAGGWTPLHRANLRIAKKLAAHGADVNAANEDGVTPLHSAPYSQHGDYLAVADFLLVSGASVNAQFNAGGSARDGAAKRGDEALARILWRHGGVCYVETGPLCSDTYVFATITVTAVARDESSPVVVAGDVEGVATAQIRVDDSTEEIGRGGGIATLQMTAYYVRRVTVIPTTVTATVRVETVETENPGESVSELIALLTVTNQSPPGIVVEAEELRTVYELPLEILAGTECPLESLPAGGRGVSELTADLAGAIADADAEKACAALRRGARTEGDEFEKVWGSALHDIASEYRDGDDRTLLDIAEMVILHGGDVNYYGGGSRRRTPLHKAASAGHRSPTSLVELLLKHGADVNAKSGGNRGKSPLDMAATRAKRLNTGAIFRTTEVLRAAGGVCVYYSFPECWGESANVRYSVYGRKSDGEILAESGGVNVSNKDAVRKGATVVFLATPSAEHYVSDWLGSCAEVGAVSDGLDGAAKECAVVADSALSVRVKFAPIPSLSGTECPAGSLPANGLTRAELNMALRLAARRGDAARVCEALRRGAEVNDNLGDSEFSALQEAVDGGYLRVSELLLANGADANTRKGDSGPASLDLAARNGSEPIAMLLRDADGRCFVETGPLCNLDSVRVDFSASGGPDAGDVSARGDGRNIVSGDRIPRGVTVVFRAAPENGHYVSAWAGSCAEAGKTSDGLSNHPRECSLRADSDLSASVIFAAIPSLAGPDCPSGSLPSKGLSQERLNDELADHVYYGRSARDVCEWLRRGADINGKTSRVEGFSDEMHAEREGYDYDGTVADDRDFYWTPLHEIADANTNAWSADRVSSKLRIAELLTANGADVDIPGVYGVRPMHVAAYTNRGEIVQFLIDHGADVSARDDYGWTPLHDAVMFDSLEAARILISHGAEVNANYEVYETDGREHHQSLLHEAARWASADMVKLLVDHGAEVNARNENTDGPLHNAALRGNDMGIQVVSILIAADADVNARDQNGLTPIWTALGHRNVDMLAFLLANGADVGVENSEGETMLEYARRQRDNPRVYFHEYAEMVALLEAAEESAENPPIAADTDAPAESEALADALRERFAGAFNPSPAFGDAFGAVSGSSESFLTRLNSLMRSSAGTGGNAWDSFGGWERENEHGRMWFSTGQRGDFGFGAGGGAGGDFSASPFAALAGNGMLAGGETGLGADGKLRIAAFADYQAKSLLDGTDRQWTQWAARGTAIETAMTEAERFSGLSENRTRGAMTELHLGGGDLGVALQAGAVSESDSVLSGTAGDENLRGLNSRTAFAGLSGAADLFGSGWRLRGSAHLGRSWAESEGLLRDSDLWASAFSAGLERGGWLYSDDGFVLRFSQPLRVENWDMQLTDERGGSRLGADPSGRQLDVDAAYRLPLSGGGWLLLSAGVRRDGGHSSSSDLEAGALFSVERGF